MLAAYLTTAVSAKPVAVGADISVACWPVNGASGTAAEASKPAAHSLADTSNTAFAGVPKQGKNVVCANAAAARNCCCHRRFSPKFFLPVCAEPVRRAVIRYTQRTLRNGRYNNCELVRNLNLTYLILILLPFYD